MKGLFEKGFRHLGTGMLVVLLALPAYSAGTVQVSSTSGMYGSVVRFDVALVATDSPIDSIGFQLGYDVTALSHEQDDFEKGSLLSDWPVAGENASSEGIIKFGAFTYRDPIPSGASGVLCSFYFTVTCETCGGGETFPMDLFEMDSDLSGYEDIDGVFTFIVPTPTPTTGTLQGFVTLERPDAPAPDSTWEVPLEVTFCSGGEAVAVYETRTDDSGYFSLEVIPGLFEVMVKNLHTLSNRQEGIEITHGGITEWIDFGELKEGDADDDNMVSASDFFILAATYNLSQGDPGFDARADFNEDGIVDSSDFFLLQGNYNDEGADCR